MIAFPYADFSRVKNRPALVIGKAEFDNLILCQITSQRKTSKKAIKLTDQDFAKGGLRIGSYIRPDKLFTVERLVILSIVGQLRTDHTNTVKSAVSSLFS